MSSERNDTNKKLREKKTEILRLEAKISDLNNLTEQRDSIKKEVTTLTKAKTDLESFISENNTQKLALTAEITSLGTQKEELDSYVQTISPNKTQLETDISALTEQKSGIQTEINENKVTKKGLVSEISTLTNDKKLLEDNVKQWTTKSELYTNDIDGIGTDNKNQRGNYLLYAGLSFVCAIILMWILLCTLKHPSFLPESLTDLFKKEVGYIFYLIVLMRVSIIAAIFILIFVFINLTRGFVSQLIRTQEKMTAVRLLVFLVTKIGKESPNIPEPEQVNYETTRIQRQSDLLSQHIPDLIEYNPTSFDKLSKISSPNKSVQSIFNKKKKQEEE
jgi:hypothetical protein